VEGLCERSDEPPGSMNCWEVWHYPMIGAAKRAHNVRQELYRSASLERQMAGRTLMEEQLLHRDEGRDGANRIIQTATRLLCCRVCADVKMS
jgi:hypothetical protein